LTKKLIPEKIALGLKAVATASGKIYFSVVSINTEILLAGIIKATCGAFKL